MIGPNPFSSFLLYDHRTRSVPTANLQEIGIALKPTSSGAIVFNVAELSLDEAAQAAQDFQVHAPAACLYETTCVLLVLPSSIFLTLLVNVVGGPWTCTTRVCNGHTVSLVLSITHAGYLAE